MEQEKLQSLLEFTSELVAGQAQLMEEMARRIDGQREEIQMLGATLEKTIEELDREIMAYDVGGTRGDGVSGELGSMACDVGTIGQSEHRSEKRPPSDNYNFKIENSDNFTTKKETK